MKAWKADPQDGRSAAAPTRAARTTCSRCCSPRRSASTPRRQLRVLRRRRRPAAGHPRRQDRRSPRPGSASSSTRSRPAQVRVLAVTSEKRLERTAGRPDAEGAGRRPGLHQLARHRGPSRHHRRRQAEVGRRVIDKMHASQAWKDALRPRTAGPTPSSAGDEFASFLTEQNKRVADILSHAGPGMSRAPACPGAGPRRARRGPVPRRWSASSSWSTASACPTVSAAADPVGPAAVPVVVGVLLIVVRRVPRRRRRCAAGGARPEGGEDVDLDRPHRLAHRAACCSARSSPTSLLIDRLGWVDLRRDPVLGQRLRPRQPAPRPRPADLRGARARHLLRLRQRARHPSAGRHPAGDPVMDASASLIEGFGTARPR